MAGEVAERGVTLFLCGDVMTGRGIDQILPFPGDPLLHESPVKDARYYVELAERHSGPIPRGVDFGYIWGDALQALERVAPDVRIINLETAVTTGHDHLPGKPVHYRMNPQNVGALTVAGIDCCVLANNHVLDWGDAGLEATLRTLQAAGLSFAGAGSNSEEAQRPAVLELPDQGRMLVFSLGSESSGIPFRWAATAERGGVHLIDESAPDSALHVQRLIERYKRPGDLVVVSIHWGSNWDYEIARDQRRFAHELIDDDAVDVIHGHSSHHVKGIEVYRDRLILYGCGDFLTDYEGIGGYESFRGDLGLMYFASLDRGTGELTNLQMAPTQMRRFKVRHASAGDTAWLLETLNCEGRELGTRVESGEGGELLLCRD